MQDLYMRRIIIGRQFVYYMVAGSTGDAPIYYRDGVPQLVSVFPSLFCTMNDALLAAAEAGYLIHIDESLYPPKRFAFLRIL